MSEGNLRGNARASDPYLEVVSLLGHELRRPLTVIRGAATLLMQSQDRMPRKNAADMLALIDRSVESMADLIEDLLTVCHLDAGDLHIQPQPVEVAALIASVVEAVRKHTPRRAIVVLGSAPGLEVTTDPLRAGQVLRALLSNAIRFSPQDPPVEISVRREPGRVKIEVLDRGPGVPARSRHEIFRRFRRLDETPGTGTGLYLAKGLVEAMGGEIGIRSRPGGGSVFWFTLATRG